MQSAGKAYRIKADVIRWELHQDGVLRQLALRYTQALMTQMAQSIVCNRHHTVDQQLCRWLLLSLDRLPGNQLNMTQELIANMLGVRREAVTEAAGKLQAAELIQYRRGRITVIDRPGLEVRVCECYKVVKSELDRLFLEIPPPLPLVPRARPSPATLRRRAEARLQQTDIAELAVQPRNTEHLVHELQVHQIELEMHNEELRIAYDEADALRARYADIYDFAPISYVTIDPEGTILDVNLAGAILLGIKRSQKGRKRFAAAIKPEYLPIFNQFLAAALISRNKESCEIALLPTGQRPETMVRIDAVHDEAEQECRMVIIDISVEKAAEKAILERSQYQRALLDNFPFSVWLKDKDSAFLAVNTPFAKNYECSTAEALVGKTDFDITSRENAVSRQNEDRSVRQGGTPQHTEKIVEIDGEQHCFEIYNSPISIDGQSTGTMGFARDVSERHFAIEALKESEQRFRRFIENIPLGISITQDGQIKFINPKGADLIGYNPEDCIGRDFLSLIHEADHPVAKEVHRRRMAGDTSTAQYDVRILHKQGHAIQFRVRASAVEWEGRIANMSIFEEVTESQFAHAELRRLATTDSLTELANRRQFMERMAEALSRFHRDPEQIASVLILDIDHFKNVNDTHGHATGDAALCLFSSLLRDELRREDTAARIGGDEFAILLPGSDLHSATTFAERLREKIAETTVSMGNGKLAIAVSIGIAALNATDTTTDQALARADAALYSAKSAGRNRTEVATNISSKADTGRHESV